MAEIRVVERDGDVWWIEAVGKFGTLEVITNLKWNADSLVLHRLHIAGMGLTTVGLRELKELARQFGRERRAKRIIIEGAKRTTGANPGHSPRPIVIELEES